ncbi:hypothetical protein ABZ464_38705 [Streptomyces sp. NPDC005820]|uniref:hypothetical protein n=1 Tax=Streptomyces sp. NPDC005820 TaxID=3157069 RepID=UPI0033C1D066
MKALVKALVTDVVVTVVAGMSPRAGLVAVRSVIGVRAALPAMTREGVMITDRSGHAELRLRLVRVLGIRA